MGLDSRVGFMVKKKSIRLGDLQLQIMQVIWQKGEPISVADVHQALAHRNLAHTTIATMLRKMEARGLLTHITEGRRFLCSPEITPDDVSGGIAQDLVDRIFGGSLAGAVSHLLQSREVDAAELKELEKLIREHKRKSKGNS